MYRKPRKFIDPNKLVIAAFLVAGIVLAVLAYYFPPLLYGVQCGAKFFILWALYGAAWFLTPALLTLVAHDVDIYIRVFKLAIRLRKGSIPTMKLPMAYVVGFFTALLHASIWAIWW